MMIIAMLWVLVAAIGSWTTATIKSKPKEHALCVDCGGVVNRFHDVGMFLLWWALGMIAWDMFGGIMLLVIDRYAAYHGYNLIGG